METAIRKKESWDMGYTVADIEALPEGQRAELIDGEMYMMASPSATHQAVQIWLATEIYAKIREKGGKCKAFSAPFAVYIMEDDKNYVEPDIVVICDRDKIDKKGCQGAPDWVIEIVSPFSKKMDFYKKLDLYERAGVREYWVIDASKKAIVIYTLENEGIPEIHSFSDVVKAAVLGDFEIDFSKMTDYEFE